MSRGLGNLQRLLLAALPVYKGPDPWHKRLMDIEEDQQPISIGSLAIRAGFAGAAVNVPLDDWMRYRGRYQSAYRALRNLEVRGLAGCWTFSPWQGWHRRQLTDPIAYHGRTTRYKRGRTPDQRWFATGKMPVSVEKQISTLRAELQAREEESRARSEAKSEHWKHVAEGMNVDQLAAFLKAAGPEAVNC